MDLTDQQFADPYGDFEKQDYDDEQSAATQQTSSDTSMPSSNNSAPQSKPALRQPMPRRSMMTPQQRQQLEDMKQLKATQLATQAIEKALLDKEKEVDAKLDRLNKLSKDELEELREKRLDQLKRKKEQREKWIANNHGRLIDIHDQKDFFSLVKSSKFVICMFYSKQSQWCAQLREHLTLLARQHLECKFTQIDAEQCPFLLERMNIWMMPTLVLAKNNKVDRQLRGLDWVAPDGKINTEFLEQKLFEYGFLEDTYLQINKQMKSVAAQQAAAADDSDDDLDL